MITTRPRIRLRYILLFAACLHVAAATGAHLAGRWGLAPGTFDHDGVASFASDGRVYRLQLAALERTLREEGATTWLREPAPVHIKLYSLSYTLFGPLAGRTILSVEPLNLFYYLAILSLVFTLGREAFGEREGLIAAGMVAALLPSFLLHTTQLLKDPLFVLLSLGLVLVCLKFLTKNYGLAQGLAAGAAGGLAAGSLWLVKHSAWPVVLAIILITAAICVVGRAWRRAVSGGSLAGVALTLLLGLSVAFLVKPYYLPKEYWMPHRPHVVAARAAAEGEGEGGRAGDSRGRAAPAEGPLGRVAAGVARTRAGFVELYPDAGSNLDAGVRFEGAADVVRYLPRAALIGLCAPFPDMWLSAGGQAGSGARLLGGAEALLMYFVQLLALLTLWRRRRQMPAWLLVSAGLVGVTALGLVVVNVGALYRQRYVFWILFVVVGADSLARLLRVRTAREGDSH